ncbi:MAG TPA: DinB family protein, partial [Micromonosporaceae bacterium]
ERLMLDGWLDFHRQTLLLKCAGLTPVQLKTAAVPPSSLTLLGLVRHMADVERWWFRQRAVGEPIESRYWTKEYPDGDFDLIESADAEADFAIFEQECELARAAVAKLPLEHTFTHPRGAEMSLRWIYVHMIEEYGRHNGHADLIRERIDGVTGA